MNTPNIETVVLAAYPISLIAGIAFFACAFAAMPRHASVDYDRLLRAVAQVESDNGKTSHNVYQLTPVWVADINRITDCEYTLAELVEDRGLAESLIIRYWKYYGARYEAREGVQADYEVLSRIHNGGPNGMDKSATLPYWNKVKKYL